MSQDEVGANGIEPTNRNRRSRISLRYSLPPTSISHRSTRAGWHEGSWPCNRRIFSTPPRSWRAKEKNAGARGEILASASRASVSGLISARSKTAMANPRFPLLKLQGKTPASFGMPKLERSSSFPGLRAIGARLFADPIIRSTTRLVRESRDRFSLLDARTARKHCSDAYSRPGVAPGAETRFPWESKRNSRPQGRRVAPILEASARFQRRARQYRSRRS